MDIVFYLRLFQVSLFIPLVYCIVMACYHNHQANRILDRKGKQTFWQWVKRIDTPRGTGLWK
jgi:hypothetical protein